MSAPELSRIVKVRPQAPERIAIEADDAERSALAERFDIPEVRSLTADLAFDGNGPAIEAKGRMVADLIQTCAVSGEEFPVRIDEALHLRFVPVGTLAIGKAGATNAALLAAAMLANNDAALAARLDAWRAAQTASVAETPE